MGANGQSNGVIGVPDGYKPSNTPLIPTPANGASAADPNFPFYETNTVFVPVNGGSVQRSTLNDNLNPWRNQSVLGLNEWGQKVSLFKVIPITERVYLRLNIVFQMVIARTLERGFCRGRPEGRSAIGLRANPPAGPS